jgi:molybdopterin converting factor small subunit
VKIAELMLKEADIKNKSKIVELQMNNAKNNVVDVENDFLETLNTELKNGNR